MNLFRMRWQTRDPFLARSSANSPANPPRRPARRLTAGWSPYGGGGHDQQVKGRRSRATVCPGIRSRQCAMAGQDCGEEANGARPHGLWMDDYCCPVSLCAAPPHAAIGPRDAFTKSLLVVRAVAPSGPRPLQPQALPLALELSLSASDISFGMLIVCFSACATARVGIPPAPA